jgi:hypothetical protein
MSDEKTPVEKTQTFDQRVSEVVDKFTAGEDGKYVLPEEVREELDEPTLYAAMAEKRRRDTQSAYTKTQQEFKAMQAENKQLRDRWKADAVKNLPEDKREELEQLKHDDPDAWRAKINEYEQEAGRAFDEQVDNISKEVQQETELERRTRVLTEFQTENPDVVINDDVIENDIPPRYTKQLENGEISFEEFLGKCKAFMTGGKVLETTPKGESKKTLQDLGGGSVPRDEDIDAEAQATYKDEIY